METKKYIKLITVDSDKIPLSCSTVDKLSNDTVQNMIKHVLGGIGDVIDIKGIYGQGSFYISVLATLNGKLCKFILEVITDPLELLCNFSDDDTFLVTINDNGNQIIKRLLSDKCINDI